MINIKQIFGKNVKRLRLEFDLTQEELAEKIDVQYQTISNIENGRYFISPENFESMCRFFNVKPIEFFLEFNGKSSDKEKLEAINSILSNLDSEILDYFYKMILALR